MTPLERYERDIVEKGLTRDSLQMVAVGHTQRLFEDLARVSTQPSRSRLALFRPRSRPAPVRGLYLWGGVGRGKTFLIDGFFECLPFPEKRRVHFERFMRDVHASLKALPRHPDPLRTVAAQVAQQVRVLCLDEFHVDDVADAMLLAGLLEGLIDNGVTLVFTSNVRPGDLYKNGLQRARFLPAIELIEMYTENVHLNGANDYRLGRWEQGENYLRVGGEASDSYLRGLFSSISGAGTENKSEILIMNGRPIRAEACGEHVAWFRFSELCETFRSAQDYLLIADRFSNVFLSDARQLTDEDNDVAMRFITLIDVLYDRQTKLVMTGGHPVSELYCGQGLAFQYQRTVSRLRQMLRTY